MIKTDALESIFMRLDYAKPIKDIKNGLKRMFRELLIEKIVFVFMAFIVLPLIGKES